MVALALTARIVLGLLFGWSALSKLPRNAFFIETIGGFGVPTRVAPLVAYTVITTELAIFVGLVFGVGTNVLIPTTWALLAVFAVVMSSNALRAIPLACGCFGASDERPAPRATLARIAMFFGLLALASFAPTGSSLEAAGLAAATVLLGRWCAAALTLRRWRHAPLTPYSGSPRRYSFRNDTRVQIAARGNA